MTSDLFKSTAYYYARYRPFYPERLIQDVIRTFSLNDTDRVIDIGSGTGQLAIQLSPKVKNIIAIEPSEEMIAEGRKLAKRHRAQNIRWIHTRAEQLPIKKRLGTFRLAAFGTSLHWMDQERVLKSLDDLVSDSGGVVVIGSASPWTEVGKWQQSVKNLIQKYLGLEIRAGKGTFPKRRQTYNAVLRRSPFPHTRTRKYVIHRSMTIDEVIGHLYSTSFANPAVFGKKKAAFGKELRVLLRKFSRQGRLKKKVEYFAIFAKRNALREF